MLVLCSLPYSRAAQRLSTAAGRNLLSSLSCQESGYKKPPALSRSLSLFSQEKSHSVGCSISTACRFSFPSLSCISRLGFSGSSEWQKLRLRVSYDRGIVGKGRKNTAAINSFSFGDMREVKEVPNFDDLTSNHTVTRGDLRDVQGLAIWLAERLPGGKAQLDTWGRTAGSKPLANLWREIVDGEISLDYSDTPKRTVHVASVKIRNSVGKVLIESHQEMENGNVRSRNRYLSEKIKRGENVSEACFRGIMEELGDVLGEAGKVNIVLGTYSIEDSERESFSYPGLLTRYIVHSMSATIDNLPDNDFSTLENEHRLPENVNGNRGLKSCGCLSADRLESDNLAGNIRFCTCRPEEKGVEEMRGSIDMERIVGVKKHFWVWRDE